MEKIPFKVSARTARLIGRENVSNAISAIIELVKNSYDADASTTILLFDIKYPKVPETLLKSEYMKFIKEPSIKKEVEKCYKLFESKYVLQNITSKAFLLLENFFKGQNTLYIIDNGEGMTKNVIKKHWMTIGTDNKELNIYTDNSRIKVGSKGIGRFALDRLGNRCDMITIPKNKKTTNFWSISWNHFEQKSKHINEIYADLKILKDFNLIQTISDLTKNYKMGKKSEIINKVNFPNGTVIKISELRDFWTDYSIKNVFNSMETLIPPKEERDFNIFLFYSRDKDNYGSVFSPVCDDYDYKLFAKSNGKEIVNITLNRKEFNFDDIDKGLFKFEEMKENRFNLASFKKGSYSLKLSIRDIMKSGEININKFEKIGPFKFTLYFMKRGYTQKDKQKYFYKDFISKQRIEWLDVFGGIKLYRDDFRIRPYGDVNDIAFDWLRLGERAAKSPAAPSSRVSGPWRVRPNQVAGNINISRLTNIVLDDKSSREGLQENESLGAFRNLLIKIIEIFEGDRQTVMKVMDKLHRQKNKEAEKVEQANEYLKSIKGKHKTKTEKLLAEAIDAQQSQIEELISEGQLLRGLASTGLTMANLIHELRDIKLKLSTKTNSLKKSLVHLIPDSKLAKLEEFQNPKKIIEDIETLNERVRTWIAFSLETLKRDKRILKKVDIYEVLRLFKKMWDPILVKYKVILNIPDTNKVKLNKKIFLIDFDSIFNNLIINSLYQFLNRKDGKEERVISIQAYKDNNNLYFIYADTGPGLLKSIKNPKEIFAPFFTTKTDRLGNKIGTGLGMYIVESTVNYYNGSVKILKSRPGFKLQINFPLTKSEGIKNDV